MKIEISAKLLLLFIVLILILCNSVEGWISDVPRPLNALSKVGVKLEYELSKIGAKLGDPIFIRIFKEEQKLEIWTKVKRSFKLYKEYPICYFSGNLGPKLAEGDKQSPEGFYFVTKHQLNPKSRFHLAFNIGYPNKYDRFHKRTGSAIMVHGNCVSIGCYAMTDVKIDEIYSLADQALSKSQKFFRVHIFPFKMTKKNLDKYKNSRWYSFWLNLKEGYDIFEHAGIPPNVEVKDGRYVFGF